MKTSFIKFLSLIYIFLHNFVNCENLDSLSSLNTTNFGKQANTENVTLELSERAILNYGAERVGYKLDKNGRQRKIIKTNSVAENKTKTEEDKAVGNEFPHQALLGFNLQKSIFWTCGGSLIANIFILTAAHCLSSKQYGVVMYVKLGMITRNGNDKKAFIYGIEERIKHQNYSPQNFTNDIALIKLNSTVSINSFINIICLPNVQPDESEVIATGFGRTGFNHVQSEFLMKTILEKFTLQECRKVLNKNIFDESMICYGHHSEQKNTCQGDSGGPIQVLNIFAKCEYTLIGITSFGSYNCETPWIPSVFVNVYHYFNWIKENMAESLRRSKSWHG